MWTYPPLGDVDVDPLVLLVCLLKRHEHDSREGVGEDLVRGKVKDDVSPTVEAHVNEARGWTNGAVVLEEALDVLGYALLALC